MQPIKLIAWLISYLSFIQLAAQERKFNIVELEDSAQYVINEFQKSRKEKLILFFCATTKVDRSVYIQKSQLFFKELLSKKLSDNVCVYFLDQDQQSCVTLNFPDTIIKFNGFNIFLLNFDSSSVFRAINKDGIASTVHVAKINNVVYQVSNKICMRSFSYIFELYTNFTKEVIDPNYSDQEMIQILKENVNTLNNEIKQQNNEIAKIHDINNFLLSNCFDENDVKRLIRIAGKEKKSLF